MSIASGSGAVLGTTSGITNLANSLAARLGGSSGSYFDQLRPASFRGVTFIVLGGENIFGRRTQLHEYPLRDVPWVEDLGRRTRAFRLTGFLVGDDVIQQRDVLIAACESAGPGSLVHPTLGRRDVSVMEARSIEKWDAGRYIELEFAFAEGGQRLFPSSAVSTTSSVLSAVTGLNVAAALNFAKTALTTIAYGAAVLGTVVNTALGWYTAAKNFIGDARNLFRLLVNLPGDFGRFAGAPTVPTFSSYPSASFGQSSLNSQQVIANATVQRANVDAAADTLAAAAAGLDATTIDTFTAAAQGLVAAVLAATTDPDDSIRLLSSLAAYEPSGETTTSAIGTAMGNMQGACGDLFRRVSIAAVAQASSSYQPTSSDDAARVRDIVVGLVDDEITVAGDQGEDETLDALQALRQAVVADLNRRGGALASIAPFSFAGSSPSLVLATRMYRDPTRADELVSQANPVHPAFMPKTFKALVS